MNLSILARRVYRFLKTGSVKSQPYLKYRDCLKNSQNNFTKAYFNLTIDLELAWSRARRDNRATNTKESLNRARAIRAVFSDFLSLCDSYNLPITFAVVARLLLSELSAIGRAPVYRPNWLMEDWYKLVTDVNLSQNPNYAGVDLLKKIKESLSGHEVASHGFSHIDLSDEKMTREIACFEINKATEILQNLGSEIFSFVFPNNAVAFVDVLKENKYQVYRTRKNEKIDRDSFGLWKFPVGIWLSPDSFSSQEAINLIDLAISRKTLVNFYCHLYEFKSVKQLKRYLIPIFEHLQKNNKLIEVVTMKKFIDKVENPN